MNYKDAKKSNEIQLLEVFLYKKLFYFDLSIASKAFEI
jgi:hypothetical protein